jgi:undecaprenyl phosphate-alpha-L-ara4N flippase subunit ArnE
MDNHTNVPEFAHQIPRAPAPRPWFLHPYLQLLVGGLFDAGGELLIKVGANAVGLGTTTGIASYVGILGSPWTWLGIISYVLGLLCWLSLLRYVPLGIAFSVITVLHMLVPLGARFLLHENVSVRRWMGIGLALAGMLMILKPVAKAEENL